MGLAIASITRLLARALLNTFIYCSIKFAESIKYVLVLNCNKSEIEPLLKGGLPESKSAINYF